MAETKVGGTWRTIRLPYARVSGTWRPCKQMYAKVGGVWKIVFDLTEPDPFDGTGSLSGALTPGYVPWEVISGTWTKSGGNVAASDASDRVAAISTGTENVEVEIDRPVAASGGTGVAFWIQDQSNWWGVRAYTEEYFVPFTNFTFYPFNCTDTYRTRSTSTVPGTPGGGNYIACYYVQTQPTNAANTNRVNNNIQTRNCSCSGNLNSNCVVNFSNSNTCSSTCTDQANYQCPSVNQCNSPCNRSPDNRSTGNRRTCGGACGVCSTTNSCIAGTNSTGTVNAPTACPGGVFNSTIVTTGPFFIVGSECTCTYTVIYNNTVARNAPFTNPATCSCTDTIQTSSNYLSFISSNVNAPVCSNTQPCSSNNVFAFTTRSCSPCNTGCTTSFSGANAAYFKRGQIVRKSSGTFSVITNQDFGDVGNLYAYTSGNTINFRQYSATGRGGTASNLVTYDAGAVTKGTKHGILVTAVPYTQSFNIARFKANL